MSEKIRVRFAPSPTGPLHMGGVRTALYNYLFAKKHKGTFVLRIEDTDQNRYVAGAEEYIINSLKWCGIEPDEGVGYGGEFGPYRQSDRKDLYKKYADQLLESGWAYIAFDDNLAALRSEAEGRGEHFIYNHSTRKKLDNSLALDNDAVAKRIASGENYVLRFKMPVGEDLVLHDEIRGEVRMDTSLLDDKVLFKSDGMPTYHLANIVDDHLMEISHVIRGEEWLPSMALHVLLYRAFGWNAPKFAHLPLILKPTGNGKLSKRDGAKFGFPVFPMECEDAESGDVYSGYKEDGYLPEAFINMLCLLGWNPGTEQEVFTLDQMIEAFSLDRVIKSGARFSPDKAKWFNEQYLREKSGEELAPYIKEEAKALGLDHDLTVQICDLMKERSTLLPDLLQANYLWQKPLEFDEKTVKKKWKDTSAELLSELAKKLETVKAWKEENVNNCLQDFMAEKEIGFGQIGPVLRLVLSGLGGGPSLPAIMSLVGSKETLDRINEGISKFG